MVIAPGLAAIYRDFDEGGGLAGLLRLAVTVLIFAGGWVMALALNVMTEAVTVDAASKRPKEDVAMW